MKSILFLFFIIGFNLSIGQEKEGGSPSPIVADAVINNGWIILQGRLLQRPFRLHLENDTFRINDFQYRPPPPDPLQKPSEWVPEYNELGKWFFETSDIFLDSCRVKYKLWRHKPGALNARDSLLQYINNQKLIKIKSFNIAPDGCSGQIAFNYRHLDVANNYSSIQIEVFSKPENEYVTIGVMFWGETDEDTTRVSQTQSEIFLNEYNQIKDLLVNGMFLYLSYGGYGELGWARERETEFINSIKEILMKPISEAQMVIEISEKLELDSLWADYIIFNRDYWLDSLKR